MKDVREALIRHTIDRDLVAVKNRHDGQPGVVVGRVAKVTAVHAIVVNRDLDASPIPIANITEILVLEHTEPKYETGHVPSVPGVSDG